MILLCDTRSSLCLLSKSLRLDGTDSTASAPFCALKADHDFLGLKFAESRAKMALPGLAFSGSP